MIKNFKFLKKVVLRVECSVRGQDYAGNVEGLHFMNRKRKKNKWVTILSDKVSGLHF